MYYRHPTDHAVIVIGESEDIGLEAGEGPKLNENPVATDDRVVTKAEETNDESQPAGENNNNNPFPSIVQEQQEKVLQQTEGGWKTFTTTRSGRVSAPPDRLSPTELGNVAQVDTSKSVDSLLHEAEQNYYAALRELSCIGVDLEELRIDAEAGMVGAALGGGFENTAELRPMKYDEAMLTSDAPEWKKSVKEEFDRMQYHKVFQLIQRSEVPKDANVITSTWAMKKKSNGTLHARLNACGYEQVDGEHYDKDGVASPTVNLTTV